MKIPIMSGSLHTSDNLEGCAFTVWLVSSDSNTYDVEIRSPYGENNIVDSSSGLKSTEVFEWLSARTDY